MTMYRLRANAADDAAQLADLEWLAAPLLYSEAFRRLAHLTFLGILSPRFSQLATHPFCLVWPSCPSPNSDGTRQEHSCGVATVALELARRLSLDEPAQRYAVAWGLTHDIATWPLSHTGEAAFRSITRIPSPQLREGMLLGAEWVPHRFHLDDALRAMDVEPARLAALFRNQAESIGSDINLLREVVHSPLTPDTLEGTWRAGNVFHVAVPSPSHVLPCFVRVGTNICLHSSHFSIAVEFWNQKSVLYNRFINDHGIVYFESAWTLAIKRECENWTLEETLEADENALVDRIMHFGVPTCTHVVRYKHPQEYTINNFEALGERFSVGDLWRVLERKPMKLSSNE